MKAWGLAGLVLLSVAAVAAGVGPLGGEHSEAEFSPPKAAVVSVQPATQTVAVGERFTNTVQIASLATPLTAFQFDLTFDPTIIRPLNVAVGGFLARARPEPGLPTGRPSRRRDDPLRLRQRR